MSSEKLGWSRGAPFVEKPKYGVGVNRFYTTNVPSKAGQESALLSSRFGKTRHSETLVNGMTRLDAQVASDPRFATLPMNAVRLERFIDPDKEGSFRKSHLVIEEKEPIVDRTILKPHMRFEAEDPTNYEFLLRKAAFDERRQSFRDKRAAEINQRQPFNESFLAHDVYSTERSRLAVAQRKHFSIEGPATREQIFPVGKVENEVRLGNNTLRGGNITRTQMLIDNSTRGKNKDIITNVPLSYGLPSQVEMSPKNYRISRGYGHPIGTTLVSGHTGDNFAANLHTLEEVSFNSTFPRRSTDLRPPFLASRSNFA